MLSNNLPNYSSNGAYDDAGKPLFYIIDNKFYDANGTNISNTAYFNYPQVYEHFSNPTKDYANYGSEVIIFKDETQCKPTYDVIYSVVRLNASNLPIRSALLHTKIYFDGFNWKKYTTDDELLYILPQYTKSSTFTMALSSKDSQGRRFLFAKAGGELNVWKYENGNFGTNQTTEFGFTHTSAFIPHIYLTGNVQYWEDEIRTELECTPLPNDKYRIALSFTDVLASPVNVKLGILDFDMTNYSYTSKYIQLPCNSTNYAYPKGIEFSPNGQYLYTTICYPTGVTPANIFNYIDCNQASPNLTAISSSKIPNQTDYQFSALELAFDKCLYFTKKNSSNVGIGLSRLQNLDTPGSLIFNDNIVTGLNQNLSKGIGQTYYPNETKFWLFNLPDQIDGENYSTTYGNGSATIYGTINIPTTFTGTNTIVRIIGNITITGGATLSFLNGVKVYINPDVKITVTNGSKIRVLTGSKLQAACEYMWDGIIADGINATVDLYGTSGGGNGATIQDAKAAITSNNGARVNIYGSAILNKNYRNIVINNYASNHTFNIKNARIGTFNPATNAATSDLIKPYFGVRSYSGIEINNNSMVNIGAFASTADLVTFNNLDLGIENINSNTNVYNCLFKNIEGNRKVKNINPNLSIPTNAVNSSEPTIGVFAYTENTSNNFNIKIGGALTNQFCTFSNVGLNQNLIPGWGVLIANNYNTIIQKNVLDNFNTGFKIQFPGAANTIEVSENEMRNTAINIFLGNCNYANQISINSNNINPVPSTQTWGYGILAVGSNGQNNPANPSNPDNFFINLNTIKNVQQGISINGHFNPTISSNNIYDITESTTGIPPCGIIIANTDHAEINNNYINGYGANWVTSGIRIEPVINTTVKCNAVREVGRALFFSGTQSSATIVNNRMTQCQTGIFLNSATLSNQKNSTTNSDNTWEDYNSFTYHSASYYSNGNQSTMWVRNTAPYYYSNFTSELYPTNDPTVWPLKFSLTNVTNAFDNCIPAQLRIGSSDSTINNEIDSLEIEIASDNINLGGKYPVTNNWYAKYNLFNKLANETNLPESVELQIFYSTQLNNNIGKIKANRNAIDANDANADLQLNYNATNIAEDNIALVRKIERKIRNKQNLNKVELIKLKAIASNCPYEYGPSVYEARALLFNYNGLNSIINECENIAPKNTSEKLANTIYSNSVINNDNLISINPNPSEDFVTIALNSELNEGEIKIKNNLGQTVYSEKIKQNTITINLKDLVSGIYFIETTCNKQTNVQKLVKK